MTATQTSPPCSPPSQALAISSRNFIEEIYKIPIVHSLCQKVIGVHTRLKRLVPCYGRFFAIFLYIATSVFEIVQQWNVVGTIVRQVNDLGLTVVDIVRDAYGHPWQYMRMAVDAMYDLALRIISKLAAHPLARMPNRLLLQATGRTTKVLESMKSKVEDERRCPGEVCLVGQLHDYYNRTLMNLTIRLKTCHNVLEELHKENEVNGTPKKRKHSATEDKSSSSSSSSSSSDDEAEAVKQVTFSPTITVTTCD